MCENKAIDPDISGEVDWSWTRRVSCLGLNNSVEKNSLMKDHWCLNSRYKQPPVGSHFSRLFRCINTCMHRSTPIACAKIEGRSRTLVGAEGRCFDWLNILLLYLTAYAVIDILGKRSKILYSSLNKKSSKMSRTF